MYCRFAGAALAALCLLFGTVAVAETNEAIWPVLKESFFSGKEIADAPFMTLEGSRGAENAAQVPVTLTIDRLPTASDAIRKVYLLVDANPIPLAAIYHFTPLSGRLQLSTRIRLESDSHVRAVGETADGKLYMSSIVIHAGGGCAGSVGGDEAAIRAAAGRIKLQWLPPIKIGQANVATLNIRHPMYTGLQHNKSTGRNEPTFFIDRVEISYNSKPVMQADLGVGIAEDPYLRFYYLADEAGELAVKAGDNEGHVYTHQVSITPVP